MKPYIYILLTSALIGLGACSKTPKNDILDGQWQLLTIQTKDQPTDSLYSNETLTKDQQIYWRFQLDLLMIHSTFEALNGHTFDTSARFAYHNNKLDVTQTYIRYHNRDSLLLDPNTTALEAVGISGNAENFNIEKLSHKQMILNNDSKRLIFRKF